MLYCTRVEDRVEKFYKSLGRKIKMMREENDMSQEELAKRINISRSALAQLEMGKRKVCANELRMLSEIFFTSTDIILDLARETQVILQKEEKHQKSNEPEIREIPIQNVAKFKEVLLYILNQVGSKENVGQTVIYKLLYFADFNFFEKYEEQLIGAIYQKNKYGPTPIEFKKIVDMMEEQKEIVKLPSKYAKYNQKKYLALRKPNLRKLMAHEIKLIDEVLDKYSDMNAKQLSEISHRDVPWLTTEDEEVIEYEKVFYRTPEFSVRDDSDDEHI
ncbi:DUF4065 domain-containing protein [bacterium]|nr:DUF4065 domain-containing protein [bacterium]